MSFQKECFLTINHGSVDCILAYKVGVVMEKLNFPNIRFKDFDDEWEKVILNEIVNIVGGGTPSTSVDEYWDGNINWFSPTEVGESVYVAESEKKITQLGLEKSSAKILPADKTILFTSRAGIGDAAILKIDSTTNQGFQSLVLDDKTDIYFLYSQKENLKRYATKNAAGSTFLEISGKELGKMPIIIPSLSEQSAIGTLFQTLDELLSAYKDNLANYQAFKATMLSKMFPKAGQTTPEIRLEGFDGEWKEKKLKDISDSIEYGLNASAKEFDGENKYLRITDIDDKSRKFIKKSMTSPDIDVANLDNYLLEPNDVLFARTGASVGKSYIYKESDGKVYFAGFLIRIRISKEYDANFVFQNTLTRKYKNFIEVTSQRSGQPGVNGKEYGDFKIFFPSLEEQQAIGAFFSNLDDLLSNYQDKITQLETLKKKLLQDMFV